MILARVVEVQKPAVVPTEARGGHEFFGALCERGYGSGRLVFGLEQGKLVAANGSAKKNTQRFSSRAVSLESEGSSLSRALPSVSSPSL